MPLSSHTNHVYGFPFPCHLSHSHVTGFPFPCHCADTVLKEHVSSLQEKQTRAHRRASRPSVSSRRHKRQPAPNRAASYPPISSAYEVDNSSDAFTPSGAVVRSASESRPPSSSGLLAEKSGWLAWRQHAPPPILYNAHALYLQVTRMQ